MKANKERYELKNRVKKLDLELRETQNQLSQRDQTIKNNDKIIWLTKEKVAFQEEEIRNLHYQLDQVRSEKEHVERDLKKVEEEKAAQEEEFKTKETVAYTKAEIEKVKNEYEGKVQEINEQKNRMEESIRDLDKRWNDAKWR